MYYKRYELQLRVNLFFSASILAGAFSGVGWPYLTGYVKLTWSSSWRTQLPTWLVLLATVDGAGFSS